MSKKEAVYSLSLAEVDSCWVNNKFTKDRMIKLYGECWDTLEVSKLVYPYEMEKNDYEPL